MTKGKIMEGVFAINKPTGISSAQVLRDMQVHFNPSELFKPWMEAEKVMRDREQANQRHRRKNKKIQVKIGHGGTLDPLATGVLIAGVGKGTKSLQDFLLCTKVYETVVLFGTCTDTYDRVGKVLKRAPYEHITKEMVEKALEQFRGKFMQLPPLFSALKMNGKPLYEYAREGKGIPRDIERRSVEVLNLELVEWMEGGTHSHVAPTDEAGYAEINVASKLWKQENAAPKEARPAKEDNEQKAPLETTEESADTAEVTSEIKAEVSTKEDAAHDEALASFEQKKRKMSEDQDELVHERPTSKARKTSLSTEDMTMSGGLGVADQDSAPTKGTPGPDNAVNTQSVPAAESAAPAESDDLKSSAVKGPPAVRLRMTVTSGFYVRSLCHDLGAAVGSAALMAELERTRQGEFELGKNCLEYKDLEGGESIWGPKVEQMLDDWYDKNEKPRTKAFQTSEKVETAQKSETSEEVETTKKVE